MSKKVSIRQPLKKGMDAVDYIVDELVSYNLEEIEPVIAWSRKCARLIQDPEVQGFHMSDIDQLREDVTDIEEGLYRLKRRLQSEFIALAMDLKDEGYSID